MTWTTRDYEQKAKNLEYHVYVGIAVILNSIVSNNYYGIPRGQIRVKNSCSQKYQMEILRLIVDRQKLSYRKYFAYATFYCLSDIRRFTIHTKPNATDLWQGTANELILSLLSLTEYHLNYHARFPNFQLAPSLGSP